MSRREPQLEPGLHPKPRLMSPTSKPNTYPLKTATPRERAFDFFIMLKDAGIRWSDDDCLRLGASLAYYAVFSIFPLLLLVVTALGFVRAATPDGAGW